MKTISVVSRKADAVWRGDVKRGTGLVSFQSDEMRQRRFSLSCRLDPKDRSEVNPEELIAAAAASCFSMALSKTLGDRDQLPSELSVLARIDLAVEDEGPRLSKLTLECEGSVPKISQIEFEDAVQATRETCPVVRALEPGFEEIEVKAKLLSI